MKRMRNWYPFKQWVRTQLLALTDRYFSVPEEPRKYQVFGKRSSHHARARRLKSCLMERLG
jgi:hypothetical protein